MPRGSNGQISPSFQDVIWLHLLDQDVIELFKLRTVFSSQTLLLRLRSLTSIACLFAREYVAIPAAGFIETEFSVPILEWHAPFAEAGAIRATGDAIHAYEYFEKRKSLMKTWPERQRAIAGTRSATLRQLSQIWSQKPHGTMNYLVDGWRREAIDPDGLWERHRAKFGLSSHKLVSALWAVPDRLEDAAFTAKLAIEAAEIPNESQLQDTANLILSREWTAANTDLLRAAVLSQIPGINVDALLSPGVPILPVAPLLRVFHSLDIHAAVRSLSPTGLFELTLHPDWGLFSSSIWRAVLAAPYAIELRTCLDATCSLVRSTKHNGIVNRAAAFNEAFARMGGGQLTATLWDCALPTQRYKIEYSPIMGSWSAKMPVRVFISHSSKDQDLASRLIEVIMAAFDISTEQLRCTSVPGFTLSAGAKTSDTLRAEIATCDVVIGLLSASSVNSAYVLFELGAAWGLRKQTFPLVLKGFDFTLLPGPLRETHALRLTGTTDVYQFVDNLGQVTKLPRARTNAARLADKVTGLVTLANS